jgi:hypothetical protein
MKTLFKIKISYLVVLHFTLFALAVGIVNPLWVNAYQAGDFWEYGWDASKTISDRDGTRTSEDSGSFTAVLGCPRQIEGMTAYEVLATGYSTPGTSSYRNYAPRWRYMAKIGRKILGSEDGISLKTIFDGQAAQWYGGGFFTTFSDTTLLTAIPGEIENEDTYNYRTNEYYIENTGPVGFYYFNYYYFGGTFPQAFKFIENVGLIESSFWGAPRKSIYSEVEPNDYQSASQTVNNPSLASGNVNVGSGYLLGIGCEYPPTNVEDWYKFTLSRSATVTIKLTFRVEADLDLFLMNDAPGYHEYKSGMFCSGYNDSHSLLRMSIDDNVNLGTFNEEILVTLGAGNYFVGVDAYANPSGGNIDYTLEFIGGEDTGFDSNCSKCEAQPWLMLLLGQ